MVRTAETAMRLAARALSQPDTLGDADCEDLHGGLIGQPVNTATSIGYVAAGVWLLARTRRLPRGSRGVAGAYGAFVALSGAGSVAYHGPQFAGAQLFHDLPIVGMLGLGLGVPVVRRFRGVPMIEGALGPRVWAAAGLGAAGGLAFLAGRTGAPTCDSGSVLQFHGLWHLCTAGAAGVWGTVLWPLPDPAEDRSSPAASEGAAAGAADGAAEDESGGGR
ncbi:MAG: hypothetical protein GY812_04840 [Actinomycetia bacterium]|nr:hypothetical protein [Actinomycetes bacterium]